MQQQRHLFFTLMIILFTLNSSAQVYLQNFDSPVSYPYNAAAAVLHPDLSGSTWTNSVGTWGTPLGGASGSAITMNVTSGSSPALTLTFNVAQGKQLNIDSFSFWRGRTNSISQNWSMTINGIAVGSGTIPTTGASTGTLNVTNPVSGLTGTVTVVLSLSASPGGGLFRLDNFTLNGTVTTPCNAPVFSTINPTSGPENTVVTITGSGFQAGSGTSAVKFNGTDAAFTVLSDTMITAIVPAGATTGNITITTNGCVGTGSSFTFLSTTCPPSASSSEIYISELYDHVPGSYGMIELYNPTNSTITFNGNYVLERYGDIGGTNASYTLILPGSIGPESTYLVRSYGTGVIGCSAVADANMGSGINSDDEIKLKKNNIVIDVAHAPGYNGYSVIRHPDATAPSATFIASDWTTTSSFSCDDLDNHIADPAAPTAAINTQPQSTTVCENGSTTLSVTASNATGFNYQWKVLNASGAWVIVPNNSNYSGATTSTLTITQIPAAFDGNQYYCQITSGACTLISTAAQIDVIAAPAVATFTVTQPDCATTTGTITITNAATGLTYNLDGGAYQAGAIFTNVATGSHTITVQNAQGCTSAPVTAIVDPAPAAPAVATFTVTQPDCTTTTATITITNAASGLTYSLDGGAYQSSATFTNVATGSHTITVQNAQGCTSAPVTAIVDPAPAAPAVATFTVTQPDCVMSTGTITITNAATGLTYSLDGGAYQSAATFTNIATGSHTITVQNTQGCTSAPVTAIVDPAPAVPAVATFTITQPDCTTTIGIITITNAASGLTYSLDGGAYQSTAIFTNVASGSHTITVQNTQGCTSVPVTAIVDPAPAVPAVATVTVTQPDCATTTAIITITNSASGLTYSLDGGASQSSAIFTNVATGSHTITVQNGQGCTSAPVTVIVNPAPAVPAVATFTVTQPDCTTSTGTITITNVAAGLTYSLDGGAYQLSATFTNVATGSHTITVQNPSGCTSAPVTAIVDPAPAASAVATFTITQPDCTTTTGTITITNTAAGLMYSLDGGVYQSTAIFTNVASGSHTITVQNTQGCTSAPVTAIVDPAPAAPAVATFTVTQPDCATSTGTITITNAAAGLTYSLDGGAYQSSATFTNVATGSHTIIVQNTQGCTSAPVTAIVDPAPAAPAVATFTVTQPDCVMSTGTITITNAAAGLTYSLDGGVYQSSATFTNVATGLHTLTVQNAQGCTSEAVNVVINEPGMAPQISIAQGCEETVRGKQYVIHTSPLAGSFNEDEVTYQWTDASGNVIGAESTLNVGEYVASNNITAAMFPLTFSVAVITASGCESTVTIEVDNAFCMIPKGISPNNDGLNDSFDLTGMNVDRISIFNRYGKEVYAQSAYKKEWHGQAGDNNELPTGTYYYVIEQNNGETKSGWVYLNRE